MSSTFIERIEELKKEIGYGTLTMKVEYNQAYAHRQHEDLAFKHPHGGGPKFLERALFENEAEYMSILAGSVFTGLKAGATLTAEHLATESVKRAPHRAGMLRGSAHPSVTDNEVVVYDRPPIIPRLGPEEIEALNMALQDPHHYYGTWPPVGGGWEGTPAERQRTNALWTTLKDLQRQFRETPTPLIRQKITLIRKELGI